MTSGAERHFAVLNVKTRGGKLIEAASVIVMHVGDDHVAHLSGVDTDHFQPLGGRAKQFALPLAGHLRVESGIDYKGALFPAIFTYNRPHEKVDGHGSIVRIAAQEVFAGAPRMMRVTNR